MLVRDVTSADAQVDCIFELDGLSGLSGNEPRRGVHIRDGEFGRFVDAYAGDLLPFSMETADVVWRFYSGSAKHRGPLYYKSAKVRSRETMMLPAMLTHLCCKHSRVRRSTWALPTELQALESCKDTIVEKFAMELLAKDTRADFRIWQVVRRYMKGDRMVVVWMGIVEPVELDNKPFSSCAMRQEGYVICQPATAVGEPPRAVDDSPYTSILRCHRMMPYICHDPSVAVSQQDKDDIGAVIEFMVSVDSISAHLEQFHDELMRESSRRLRKPTSAS